MPAAPRAACSAGYDEKNPERLNSRNGYRERSWDTRAGSVELKIPKLRQGSYFPEFLEPRPRIGKLELRVPHDRDGRFSTELFERYQRSELYVQDVSTREIKAVTGERPGRCSPETASSEPTTRLIAQPGSPSRRSEFNTV